MMFRVLVFSLMTATLVAGDQDPLRILKPLEGTWEMHIETFRPDGSSFVLEPSQVVFKEELHGKIFSETFTVKMPHQDFHILMLHSFDAFRGVFRGTAVDSVSGMMDFYEGALDGKKLIFTNLKSQTFYRLSDGREPAFRLIYDLENSQAPSLDFDWSFDEGKSWSTFQRITYKRPVDSL